MRLALSPCAGEGCVHPKTKDSKNPSTPGSPDDTFREISRSKHFFQNLLKCRANPVGEVVVGKRNPGDWRGRIQRGIEQAAERFLDGYPPLRQNQDCADIVRMSTERRLDPERLEHKLPNVCDHAVVPG